MSLDITWVITGIGYVVIAIFVGASGSITFYFLKTIFEDHRQIGEIDQRNEVRYERILKELEELREMKQKVEKIEKSLDSLTNSLSQLEDRIIGGE